MPGTPKINNEVAISVATPAVSVPSGEYHVIAWELDLTGRRLLDEICQISAYTPGNKFSQYVMPYRRPNPAAQHRHNIRIVSTGRYRVMKNNTTGKVLKTKSEISALTDFLAWLETVRGKDGIILLSYELRTVIPHILLESIRKYNMMDQFCAIVKGFVNGFDIADKKCPKAANNNSLHSLSRLLLGKDDEMETSLDRARLTLEVALQLCSGRQEGGDKIESIGHEHRGDGDSSKITGAEVISEICKHALSVNAEELELAKLKALLVRQSTFRPVFGPMVQKNRRERQRASAQRQLIAEAGLDFHILEAAYKEKGKEGIASLMTEKMTNANSKVTEELLTLFMHHFEPPKEEAKVGQNGKEAVKQGAKTDKTADDKTGLESPTASDGIASTRGSPLSNISTPSGEDGPLLASSPDH